MYLPVIEWNVVNGTEITDGKTTIQIGDYVNYNPQDGATKTTETSYLADNGYGDQVFNLSSYTEGWRVLGVEDGKVILISADIIGPDSGGYVDSTNGNKFYLKGQSGYANCIQELNKISRLYGQGKYADRARSVTVDDINKITGYNPNNVGVKDPEQTGSGTKFDAGAIGEYGNAITYYWQGTEYPYYSGKNGKTGTATLSHSNGFHWFDRTVNKWKNVAKSTTATTSAKEVIAILEQIYYWYYPETLNTIKDVNASTGISQSTSMYDMLFKDTTDKSYWLASTDMLLGDYCANFGVRYVNSGYVGHYNLYYSTGSANTNTGYCGIRPVIYLESDLEFHRKDDIWEIRK